MNIHYIPGHTLKQIEKEYILSTLEAHAWNQRQAAKALGLSYRGLRYKLDRYKASGTEIPSVYVVRAGSSVVRAVGMSGIRQVEGSNPSQPTTLTEGKPSE